MDKQGKERQRTKRPHPEQTPEYEKAERGNGMTCKKNRSQTSVGSSESRKEPHKPRSGAAEEEPKSEGEKPQRKDAEAE